MAEVRKKEYLLCMMHTQMQEREGAPERCRGCSWSLARRGERVESLRNVFIEKERIVGKSGIKLIANNKKAFFDYFIDEKFECGISLAGTEVKSLRMGKCSIKESFVRIIQDEVMILGMHISPYEKGNIFNKDPLRDRKLLMHRYEINKLKGKIQEKGYTLIPLQVYFKGSLVKVEIGLARGKKLYDKRADIAKKDQRRELEKDFKVKNLY